VPSLFRRKSTEPEVEPVVEQLDDAGARRKSYTPSKREQGKTTPKRPGALGRRAEPPPTNRREAYKRTREKQRAERAEQRAGMMAGDERYLLPRDRGPERGLTRDIVDSRRTLGTWFFTFAILLFVGTTAARVIPPVVLMSFNAIWAALGLAVVLDCFLICRMVKRLIRDRYPKSTQKMSALYVYAIMRSVTYRRMRIPKPRVKIGEAI
jgi:Protein of unknown function (DUF3043)